MSIDCCKSYVGKQIIGLLPSEQDCLYYLVIDSIFVSGGTFVGCTINGQPVGSVANAFFTSIQPTTTSETAVFWYTGNQPDTIVVVDPFNIEFPFTYTKVTDLDGSCDPACYQASFDYGYVVQYFEYFTNGGAYPASFGGISIDDQTSLYNALVQMLGPDITVSSVWNGSQYVVTINGAFALGSPLQFDDGAGNVVAFDLLPCEITPPTPVPLSLLTAYPGATAAYSVRKLSTTYTGAAIRVRRSSDNTEQDIGFSGVNLDETALTTFVGANNGFVTKWYDQTGNGRTAQQNTAIFQCKIVNSGTIISENSKPSIEFVNVSLFSNIKLPIINLTTQLDSSFLITSVVKANTQTSYKGIFSTQTSGSNGLMMLSRGGSNNWGTYGGGAYQPSNSNIQAQPLTLITMQSSNGNSGNFYKNSSADGTFANTEGQTYVGIGGQPSQEFVGKISELILYPTNQSANRVGIETDIINYYGI